MREIEWFKLNDGSYAHKHADGLWYKHACAYPNYYTPYGFAKLKQLLLIARERGWIE